MCRDSAVYPSWDPFSLNTTDIPRLPISGSYASNYSDLRDAERPLGLIRGLTTARSTQRRLLKRETPSEHDLPRRGICTRTAHDAYVGRVDVGRRVAKNRVIGHVLCHDHEGKSQAFLDRKCLAKRQVML